MKSLAISLVLLFSALAIGQESVIYSFQGGTDGECPRAGLVADKSGNFFGTTEFGGGGPCTYINFTGCGTVFELSPNGKGGWTKAVLYRFKGKANGSFPTAELVIDATGAGPPLRSV